jgi:hypothetical protein
MVRKATAIGAVLATTTAVAACGGSTPKTTTSAIGSARSSAGLKLAECMRTHGVPDFPDPQSGGGFAIQASAGSGGGSISVDGREINASQPAFRTAMDECQKYQPQGPPISGAQLARIKQGAIKMAECMRSHGVPGFPDPRVTTGPGGHGIQVQIGMGAVGGGNARGGKAQGPSPAVQHAITICQPLMGGLKRRTA